jgi:hypothetical protein
MLKTNLRKKKRRNNSRSSLSRRRNTGCNQWQITDLTTASKMENKYSSLFQPSKRCEK